MRRKKIIEQNEKADTTTGPNYNLEKKNLQKGKRERRNHKNNVQN